MDSDSDTSIATQQSYPVEDFSPPSSPEVEVEEVEEVTVEEASGPQPYMFEPLAREMPEAAGATGGAEPDEAMLHRTGPVTEWCTCGHCTSLSAIENVCCRETPKVMHRCRQYNVACITEHPGFEHVALSPHALQVAYATYLQFFGEMESQEPMQNSCYRHLAYRNVVRWCWGYLGQHVRVVIPSCAVSRIRQEFPENGPYKGFLPPLDFGDE